MCELRFANQLLYNSFITCSSNHALFFSAKIEIYNRFQNYLLIFKLIPQTLFKKYILCYSMIHMNRGVSRLEFWGERVNEKMSVQFNTGVILWKVTFFTVNVFSTFLIFRTNYPELHLHLFQFRDKCSIKQDHLTVALLWYFLSKI